MLLQQLDHKDVSLIKQLYEQHYCDEINFGDVIAVIDRMVHSKVPKANDSDIEKEHKEVTRRIAMLNIYLLSDEYNKASKTEQALAQVQLTAMRTYQMCLVERIDEL